MAGALSTEERVRGGLKPSGATPAADLPVVIRVEDLSVRLSLQKEQVTTLRERAIRLLNGKPVEVEEFWPVRNVTFDVRRGEAFGIVGRNGAGKSTLLKAIAGVVAPTLGTVEVRGRIAPLLELGAGFDPDLTGRENIYLYGSLLGFPRKRLQERFDSIVDFAELRPFIDVPLKNYSSGMSARLGFAVATDVDADILIVDEALTVGDSRFQLKCMERIEDFRSRGMSILFVSHNVEQVRRLCTRALWIDNGDVFACGPVDEVLGAYTAGEYEPPVYRTSEPPPELPVAETRYVPFADHSPDSPSATYDFIDVSVGDGGSVGYCIQRFGGCRALEVTAFPHVIEGAHRFGADGLLTNPATADFALGCVRFVSLMDSLHYFRAPDELEQILARASRWARDFLFIRMPSFEDEEYLKTLGLKWFWCDWTRLPAKPRLGQVTTILRSLGLDQYSMNYRQPTLSSDAPSLLPLSAPPNQTGYDPVAHGPKPSITFPVPLHGQIDIFVSLRAFDPEEWREIVGTESVP